MREMKDSGIEWIGKIPEEWTKDKAIRLFNIIGSGTTPKNITSDFPCVNWIQSGDINGSLISSCKNNVSESIISQYSALKIYAAPFIVIAMYGASVGNTSISLIDGCVNQACCVLSASIYNLNYAFYAIKSSQNYLIRKAIGGGQPNISQDTIKQLWLPLPALHEQERIAAFLDAECAEIDAVLEKTRASIEEYKKLKQAVITRAVTKGIRGDRPMKNSGIEWIGDIPVEWDYTKAKNCVNIQNGSDPKTEGSIPVYGSGASSFKTCGEYKEGPSVLIGRKGATLHIPHYVSTKFWNVDTAFNVYAKPNFDLKFYFYCACSFDYRFYISQTTLPSMTQTAYENMFLPLPSNDEQRAIASYLDNRCEEIDALIWKKQECLVEIENYKKSLIYEYVTGKKEVV